MSKTIRVAIAEDSPIVRSGLEAQLRKLTKYKVQIISISVSSPVDGREGRHLYSADIFVLNPLLFGLTPMRHTISSNDQAKFVALSFGTYPKDLFREYDAVLCVSDSTQEIVSLFERLASPEEAQIPSSEESNSLTPREREVVVCIVKGMTNKEIAQQLFLSPHTVITHRRNISKKLQIHSSSGLTIYAIMNKLVELSDIKTNN